MTYEQVESFLAVVQCGNFSTAAEYLYVSQSTVSSRLHLLEQELGTSLLLRKKGHRAIELTSYGRSFIPIAEQWAALWKDTQHLKDLPDIQTLRIAGIDAINTYTFLPLYRSHIEKYPNIKLSIHTYHSREIYERIQNRSMDLGFVFNQYAYPEILSRPIYSEQMFLLCAKGSAYKGPVCPDELNPEEEVFLHWGVDYQHWHDSHFNPAARPFVTVGTGSMMQHYFTKPTLWAIAPLSVARAVERNRELSWYPLAPAPPPRVCYMLTNRYAKPSKAQAIACFAEEADAFARKNLDGATLRPASL